MAYRVTPVTKRIRSFGIVQTQGFGGIVESLCFLQDLTEESEAGIFSLIPHEDQRLFKNSSGIGMNNDQMSGAGIIVPCIRLGIFAAVVGDAGGSPVADHFRHIAEGHLAGERAIHRLSHKVDPVLVMVSVPALMMQPCLGIAVDAAVDGIGGPVAVIVIDTRQKFRGRIFGKIMQKTLPVQPDLKTALTYVFPVDVYSLQMTGKALPPAHFLKMKELLRDLPGGSAAKDETQDSVILTLRRMSGCGVI